MFCVLETGHIIPEWTDSRDVIYRKIRCCVDGSNLKTFYVSIELINDELLWNNFLSQYNVKIFSCYSSS